MWNGQGHDLSVELGGRPLSMWRSAATDAQLVRNPNQRKTNLSWGCAAEAEYAHKISCIRGRMSKAKQTLGTEPLDRKIQQSPFYPMEKCLLESLVSSAIVKMILTVAQRCFVSSSISNRDVLKTRSLKGSSGTTKMVLAFPGV